ncbi:hypothetical protein AUJ14_05820 [Candidatus Micrarchaeota archaeon CG1_02_55_22]|nr:MAG: hypothetical protein AUJ14_05820 [Candidatus Micrarchaeota archaeon CG1_02_55_22]
MPAAMEWNSARVNLTASGQLARENGFALDSGVWRHPDGHAFSPGNTLKTTTARINGESLSGVQALRAVAALTGTRRITLDQGTVKALHVLHPLSTASAERARATPEGIEINTTSLSPYSRRVGLAYATHRLESALLYQRGGKWRLKGSLSITIVSSGQTDHVSEDFELEHNGSEWLRGGASTEAAVLANRHVKLLGNELAIAQIPATFKGKR